MKKILFCLMILGATCLISQKASAETFYNSSASTAAVMVTSTACWVTGVYVVNTSTFDMVIYLKYDSTTLFNVYCKAQSNTTWTANSAFITSGRNSTCERVRSYGPLKVWHEYVDALLPSRQILISYETKY